MTDPDKQSLLHDLWQDDEATLREASLQRMIGEGRRVRRQRRVRKTAFAFLAVAAGSLAWWQWRPLPPAPGSQPLLTIHRLTEAELKDRLSSRAVAYVGPPGAQRAVLLDEFQR